MKRVTLATKPYNGKCQYNSTAQLLSKLPDFAISNANLPKPAPGTRTRTAALRKENDE